MPIIIKKFLAISIVMLVIFAPSTLRIPISFVRCTVVNAANPNKPKHASNMASVAATVNNVDDRCSPTYNLL